ncbi:MAG: bifunctional DNA primase/polymerase [Acidobacteriia bacterium]|nr:bifunctional DNA primase/polymerase [Terriglobia bacterium]
MTTTLDAARDYFRHGWMPLPVPHGEKDPNRRRWQEFRTTEAELPRYFENGSNIGILTGEPSNGLEDVDLDTLEAVALAPSFLPPTSMRSGRFKRHCSHWWFRVVGAIPSNATFKDVDADKTTLLELRGSGRQTVVAPSRHPDGDEYCWDGPLEPLDITGDKLLEAVRMLAGATIFARHWPRGPSSRHDIANALGGMLLRAGWSEDRAAEFTTSVARAAGDEEAGLRADDVRATARRMKQGIPTTGVPTLAELLGKPVVTKARDWLGLRPEPTSDAKAAVEEDNEAHLTELGLAQRIVRQHGASVRYCFEWKKWYAWSGTRWEHDAGANLWRLAKDTVRTLYREAGAEPHAGQRAKAVAFALKCEKENCIRAALSLARSEPNIPVATTDLDRDRWLLNTPSGTVDLRNGTLRPHRREDLLTKLCATPYDPTAKAPTWERFLLRIFNNDVSLILYLERLLGYAITGTVQEEILAVFYGRGANGKSTLTGTIHGTIGSDYAGVMPHHLLVHERKDTHPTAFADLRGKRFVYTHELDAGARLSEGLVKHLTGGDRLKARRMKEDFWEYEPTHTVFLGTNSKPIIRGTDDGIWRRVHLVPWTVQIPKNEQDTQLRTKLLAEAPGILRWLVQGALDWQSMGLAPPAPVVDATANYRNESDTLGDYLSTCRLDPQACAPAKNLYESYTSWHKSNLGGDPMTQTLFGRLLAERGFSKGKDKKTSCVVWLGIAI